MTKVETLKYHWKWGSVQSPGSTKSAGVAILYNNSYFDEIISSSNDNDGRYCSLTAKKDDEIYFFLNIYAPNDHYLSATFFEKIDNVISKTTD